MSGPEKEREIKMLSELKKIEAANDITAFLAPFDDTEKRKAYGFEIKKDFCKKFNEKMKPYAGEHELLFT